jgi:hypothetical protein
MNAIIEALDAHQAMSKQASDSEHVRDGLRACSMRRRSCMKPYGIRIIRRLERPSDRGLRAD